MNRLSRGVDVMGLPSWAFGYEDVERGIERGRMIPPSDTIPIVTALRRVMIEPVDWTALCHRCQEHTEWGTLKSLRARAARSVASSGIFR